MRLSRLSAITEFREDCDMNDGQAAVSERPPRSISPHKVAVIGMGKLGTRIAGELRKRWEELVTVALPYVCRGASVVWMHSACTRPQSSQPADSTLQNSRAPP